MIVVRSWSREPVRSVKQWISTLAIGCGLLLSGATSAQDWCGKDKPAQAGVGGFTLKARKGCAPFVAQIIAVPSSVSNATYIFDYKGGDPFSDSLSKRQTSSLTHTFTRPGKYRILQVGSGGGSATGTVYCDEVDVLDVTRPTVTVATCSGGLVTLTIAKDAIAQQYDEFQINWGDGKTQLLKATALAPINHQYADSTPRTINIQPVYLGVNCSPPPIILRVALDATETKPVITRLSTSGNTTILQVQALATQTSLLYQKNASGTFMPTALTLTGSGTLTVNNVVAHPTCFKLVVQTTCDQPVKSDEVCSLGLEIDAQDKRNEIRWTTLGSNTSFRQYILTKDGHSLGTFDNVAATSVIDDQGLRCGQQYCYQVTAQTNTTEIISDRKCVTITSTEVPSPFTIAQASVQGSNEVDVRGLPSVTPTQNPVYKMIVLRTDRPNAPFVPIIEEINRNVSLDSYVETTKQAYCYQLVYQNACGVSSDPSRSFCTIWLGSKTASTIDWSSDSPFAGEEVEQYMIEKIDENGTVREEIPMNQTTSYRPDLTDPDIQRFRFRVKAISKTGSVSYSNFYTLTLAARLIVPDAFTPNGDGINDRFEIKGSAYFESIQMTIFNRWGETLFQTKERKGWDGTSNGQPAPPGSYAYRIDTRDQTGQETTNAGSLSLIR